MTRLIVLTTPDLAAGYRLAGVAVFAVASTAQATAQLEDLLDHEDGVIALHAPYFHALAPALARRLDTLRSPLVVPLPAGTTPEEADDRRAQLLKLLHQAVGYEITFRDQSRAR